MQQVLTVEIGKPEKDVGIIETLRRSRRGFEAIMTQDPRVVCLQKVLQDAGFGNRMDLKV